MHLTITKDNPLLATIVFLFTGHLLLGVAHIAILPPWEGFDETAHYSYLQQIADTHKLPRQGTARMSGDVEKYRLFAPIPYSSDPPMERNGGFTYKSFFEAPLDIVARGHDYVHGRLNAPRHYTKGKDGNWQSQHPPLYYLVLSPIYLATRHLSWAGQLFILRLISYLFGWSALMVGVCSCIIGNQRLSSTENKLPYEWAMLGLVTWPIIMPSWFPEMARLGNDSLCALIMALIWFFVVRASDTRLSLRYSLALGMLLGLGCLAKAFFVPVTIGVLTFLLVRQFKLQGTKGLKSLLFSLSLMLLIIACISGWWYAANWYQYGVALGSLEMITLQKAGGLLKALIDKFSIKAWLRGYAALLTTLGWCCTWSLARPPYIFLAPLAFIVIFAASSYIIALRRFKITTTAWLPAWCSVPVLLGLSYHVLIRIALTGEGRGTGGYWLHFLVVPLAVGLGIGFGAAWFKRGFRRTVSVLFLYAVAFSVAISWAQLLLFSGIIFKAGSSKFYQLPETMPPLLGVPEALSRLTVITYPNIGIIAWLFGGVMVVVGLKFAWKSTQQLTADCMVHNQAPQRNVY
jgi:hypothetical protein